MATELRNNEPKKLRGDLKLVPSVKEQIEVAAQLSGRSFNQFVTDAAVDAANKTIEQHLRVQMTLKEAEQFVEAVLNPRDPNDALIEAARLYASRNKKK